MDPLQQPPFASMRRFPLDGALLLFDRDTGLCALCDGPETAELRQQAPRFVQFGITNACNLACNFCSRDQRATSRWTVESAFELLAELAAAGVLEVAFGGGEPFVFRRLPELICRLHDETPLAVNLTTNGTLLSTKILRSITGKYGQIRLSLYDDNDWRRTLALLVDERARFGVNYLVTPARLDGLEALVFELVSRGCADILLLSYNGRDAGLHLAPADSRALARRVRRLATALQGRCAIKLDVCWGDRMQGVPRLFDASDCGAGREFVVITSDRNLQPCSFHHLAYPIETAADVLRLWREANAMRGPAREPGCARLPNAGLTSLGVRNANSRVEQLR